MIKIRVRKGEQGSMIDYVKGLRVLIQKKIIEEKHFSAQFTSELFLQSKLLENTPVVSSKKYSYES